MKKFVFCSAVFLLSAWLIGLFCFAYKIEHYQIDKSTKTQAIVVLTGGRYRIEEAVKLLNAGLADTLFISGVQKNTSLQDIEKVQDVDMPQENVAMEKKSKNTIENAIQTQAWLKKNNITSIRLVTSNYHLPRSMLEFQYQNPDLKIIPYPVFSDFVAKDWWKKSRSFCLIASEYNKFLAVWIMRHLSIQG